MTNDNSNLPDPKDAWKQYIPSEVNESWKENQEMWKQEVDTWKPMFEKAKDLHEKAVNGDEKAVKEVFKMLKEVRKKAPSNNLVEAYYGSVIALLGRDASDTMDRFRLVRKGMKILDDVVNKEPDHVEIRMLRGYVSYNIPEMYFQRTSTAVEDFQHLIQHYELNSNAFSEKMYWNLLYDLGVSYRRIEKEENAQETFAKLLRLNPNKQYQTLIEQENIMNDAQITEEPERKQKPETKEPEPAPQQDLLEDDDLELESSRKNRRSKRRSKARRSR